MQVRLGRDYGSTCCPGSREEDKTPTPGKPRVADTNLEPFRPDRRPLVRCGALDVNIFDRWTLRNVGKMAHVSGPQYFPRGDKIIMVSGLLMKSLVVLFNRETWKVYNICLFNEVVSSLP
jgi:hypothetical protein